MPKKEATGNALSPKAQVIADVLDTELPGVVVPRKRFIEALLKTDSKLFKFGGGASIGNMGTLLRAYKDETGNDVESVYGQGYRLIEKKKKR